MTDINELLEANRAWAKSVSDQNPEFFSNLARQQTPQYLWIGCSDSRVPANQITGLLPGEVFVHRNIANQVHYADFNCLSVLQYAVEVLKVEHIIVCGHYGCGGVEAAMGDNDNGIVDEWLRGIKELYSRERAQLEAIADPDLRFRRLCELNVKAQVARLAGNKVVQGAWQRGQQLAIHGWIYGLEDGLIHNLDVTADGMADIEDIYRISLS